jgi:hypothetical protein
MDGHQSDNSQAGPGTAVQNIVCAYKRLHPSLSFYKLWAFWSAILSAVVTLLFALGVVRM